MVPDLSFTVREELTGLVSPVRDRALPRYNWYMFKHSYSKDLVTTLLADFKLEKGKVLDPFCGGGTTLLACKEKGIESVGYDIMPFSAFISQAKSGDFDASKIRKYLTTFAPIPNNEKFPDVAIVDKAFTPEVKRGILEIKGWINSLSDKQSKQFFLLALFNTVDKVSRAVKSGGFLRLTKKRRNYEQTVKTFLRISKKMLDGLEESGLKPGTDVKVVVGDARLLPAEAIYDAVITSPPYPNRHDYTRVYALELLTAFIKDNDELKDLRYHTLRSHVEARKQKYKSNKYKQPVELKQIIATLKLKEMNNRGVIPMLEDYFEDMYLVLKGMRNSLKKNGNAAMVVSNVRYAGIPVPVDTLLAEIGAQAGLKTTAIWVARERGNSAQQMKKYGRKINRESVIIWKKS